MAWAVTSHNLAGGGFCLHGTGDATGCEELLAAQGAGTYIQLLGVVIAEVDAAATITVGSGETTGAVTNPILGPLAPLTTQDGGPFVCIFPAPVELAANTALTVDASGATINVTAFVKVRKLSGPHPPT